VLVKWVVNAGVTPGPTPSVPLAPLARRVMRS
jgi:hypothetical protein